MDGDTTTVPLGPVDQALVGLVGLASGVAFGVILGTITGASMAKVIQRGERVASSRSKRSR